MNNIALYLYSLLTVLAFVAGLRLSQRWRSAVLNPFIISLAILVATLVVVRIPYADYYQGNALLNNLLGVAVVSLALPFYEQFGQIRKQWKWIARVVVFATLFSMGSGALLALLFGGSHSIIAAVLPKSVTAPIAIAITNEMGGESAISIIGVTIAGITGSAFGISVLKWCGIHHPHAIGLSMGAASHALGTARSLEFDRQAGSYASIALVLCGVLSSISAPFVFRLVSALL